MKPNLTDEEVELEIQKLRDSEYVRLARRENRVRYARRQVLYNLRALEKKGRELAEDGMTMETLDNMEQDMESDVYAGEPWEA